MLLCTTGQTERLLPRSPKQMSDWSRWHPQHLANHQACFHANSRCVKSLSSCTDFYPERWVGCAPGLKSKSEPMCNTCHLGLACRSVESGTRAVEGSSLPVWKSVWWSPAWGLSLPQPVGQSDLPAGEGSWGTPAIIHSSMNTFQYSSSTTTSVCKSLMTL